MTFQYSALDETFFKNVFRIKEGHYFTYKDGVLDIKPYWDMKVDEKDMSLEESIDLIDKTVLGSVDAHKFADVEVGAFVSSGVDSSYVASTLRPEHTYSIGFGQGTFNESKQAKQLTDMIGLNNTSLKSMEMKRSSISHKFNIIWMNQIQSFLCALFFLAELAARDVRVVMSGEGADELLLVMSLMDLVQILVRFVFSQKV